MAKFFIAANIFFAVVSFLIGDYQQAAVNSMIAAFVTSTL